MLFAEVMIMFSFACLFLILGIERQNVVYHAISIIVSLVVMAANLAMEIPFDTTQYDSSALLAISFGIVLVNAIGIVLQYFDITWDIKQPIHFPKNRNFR